MVPSILQHGFYIDERGRVSWTPPARGGTGGGGSPGEAMTIPVVGYGVDVPYLYGGPTRLTGSYVFIDEPSVAVDHYIKTFSYAIGSEEVYDKTPVYTWQTTFAVMLCEEATALNAVYADGKLIWKNGNKKATNYESIEQFLSGGDHGDAAYIQINGWKGDSVPAITCDVTNGTATCGSIAAHVCEACGLTSDDYDFSALTAGVRAYVRESRMQGRAVLDALQSLYQFDFAEVEGKLVGVPRGGSVVATLTADELGATAGTDARNKGREESSLGDPLSLPDRVEVTYVDPAQGYGRSVQSAVTGSGTQNLLTAGANVVFTADEAAGVARRILFSARSARGESPLSLLPMYLDLPLCSPLLVPIDGTETRMRVERLTIPIFGPIGAEVVSETASDYTETAIGMASSYVPPSDPPDNPEPDELETGEDGFVTLDDFTLYEPVANGDLADTELLFHEGDVILHPMV